MIELNLKGIEVAFFISNFSDVTGTVEEKGKGKTPKGTDPLQIGPWACNEELHDCHQVIDGALSEV